jgi:hypothetical protein
VDVFLDKLGRQITISSPKDLQRAEEPPPPPSPNELDQFERAMMESSSPDVVHGERRPSPVVGGGSVNGLFESEESEEE